MTANELADNLKEYAEDDGYNHLDYMDSMGQAAIMLRQQAKEIEGLKATRLEYAEAVLEALDSWGCYASDYFQKKWGYKEEVAKWQNTIKTLREASKK